MKPNITPPKSPLKWAAIGVGTLFGIAHLGMVGHLINRPLFPNLPVGNYTSYTVEYGRDGYRIRYNANDPKVMTKDKYIDKKNGFFGIGGKTNIIQQEQYTMDGATHLGGGEGKLTAQQVECIKAEGGGESAGRQLGATLGAAAAPSLLSIPYVGWLAAGWAVMLGQDKGANIGGDIAKMGKDCE
jgi:hypothetical protein